MIEIQKGRQTERDRIYRDRNTILIERYVVPGKAPSRSCITYIGNRYIDV